MRILRTITALLLFPTFIFANNATEDERQLFIDRFIDIAVEEMGRTGIPASIKLGQAIIESGWGQGAIASGANNFFCIKCYNGWEGPTFKEWDDETEKSCFRKYENVVQSFIDHSDFLTRNARYRPLFEIDRYDYKAWAYGLKKCGYATNKQYAEKLIEVIEGYGLWVYDYAIPASQLNVLATDEIEMEEESLFEEEPVEEVMSYEVEESWQPASETGSYVSAPAVMEVPGYRRESLPNTPMASVENQEIKPIKRKIRPILPVPNIDVGRR